MVAFLGILLGQITGNLYLDGVASVLIGVILAATAVWLAYETKGLLIGESANRWVVDGIREMVREHSRIQHVNEILTMHMGPEFILVNLSVDFVDPSSADEVENAVADLDGRIKSRFPNVKRVFIEAEARRLPRAAPGASSS